MMWEWTCNFNTVYLTIVFLHAGYLTLGEWASLQSNMAKHIKLNSQSITRSHCIKNFFLLSVHLRNTKMNCLLSSEQEDIQRGWSSLWKQM